MGGSGEPGGGGFLTAFRFYIKSCEQNIAISGLLRTTWFLTENTSARLLHHQVPSARDDVEMDLLPPRWVDCVTEAQESISKIRERISQLQKAQQKRLRQVFTQDDKSGSEIEALSTQISALFKKAEADIRGVQTTGGDMGRRRACCCCMQVSNSILQKTMSVGECVPQTHSSPHQSPAELSLFRRSSLIIPRLRRSPQKGIIDRIPPDFRLLRNDPPHIMIPQTNTLKTIEHHDPPGMSSKELILRENAQRKLAIQLQGLSGDFRQTQKQYLEGLKSGNNVWDDSQVVDSAGQAIGGPRGSAGVGGGAIAGGGLSEGALLQLVGGVSYGKDYKENS